MTQGGTCPTKCFVFIVQPGVDDYVGSSLQRIYYAFRFVLAHVLVRGKLQLAAAGVSCCIPNGEGLFSCSQMNVRYGGGVRATYGLHLVQGSHGVDNDGRVRDIPIEDILQLVAEPNTTRQLIQCFPFQLQILPSGSSGPAKVSREQIPRAHHPHAETGFQCPTQCGFARRHGSGQEHYMRDH